METLKTRLKAKFDLKNHSNDETKSIKSSAFSYPIELAEKVVRAFDIESDVSVSEVLPPSPDSEEFLDGLMKNALLLIDNGDYKLAMNILKDILMRNSHYVEAVEWLGYCFKQTNDLHNALKCYAELTKMAPDETSYCLFADTLYEMGREAEAEHYYQRALGLVRFDSPLLFNIHKNLGNISVKAGDIDQAEESYNKAYNICPHSDVLFVNYGTLELQKGNVEIAAVRFKEATELNAQNDKAWVGLSLIHDSKGDKELAVANMERALDANPKNETAIRVLCDWAIRDQNYKTALRSLELYFELGGQNEDLQILNIELLMRKGAVKEATIELEKAWAQIPHRKELNVLESQLGNVYA